jgi:DNA repair exonuclease SbcCD nuclease subunit
MESLKILCIGDPHFKADNQLETDQMERMVRDLIMEQKPMITVVLGDILHSNEKINLHVQKRAISFFRTLKEVSPYLYVIIGNHDRPNNGVFMTDEHPFTSLSEWGSTVKVVDTTHVANHFGYNLVFVPYVPVGRFEEAMKVGEMEPPYSHISMVFAHQEFRGCKMSAITSADGDEYKPCYPMCVSGHIHDYDELQPNLIYTGTPIQHTCSDRGNKSVSLFTLFSKDSLPTHERIFLRIGKRLNLKLTPEELLQFVYPDDSKVKIKVLGEAVVLKDLMKTDHVQNLLRKGVKIEECPITKKMEAIPLVEVKIRSNFQTRLIEEVQRLPVDFQTRWKLLFP